MSKWLKWYEQYSYRYINPKRSLQPIFDCCKQSLNPLLLHPSIHPPTQDYTFFVKFSTLFSAHFLSSKFQNSIPNKTVIWFFETFWNNQITMFLFFDCCKQSLNRLYHSSTHPPIHSSIHPSSTTLFCTKMEHILTCCMNALFFCAIIFN